MVSDASASVSPLTFMSATVPGLGVGVGVTAGTVAVGVPTGAAVGVTLGAGVGVGICCASVTTANVDALEALIVTFTSPFD